MTPHPLPLSMYIQNSSTPLTLNVQFQTNSLSPQSIIFFIYFIFILFYFSPQVTTLKK